MRIRQADISYKLCIVRICIVILDHRLQCSIGKSIDDFNTVFHIGNCECFNWDKKYRIKVGFDFHGV